MESKSALFQSSILCLTGFLLGARTLASMKIMSWSLRPGRPEYLLVSEVLLVTITSKVLSPLVGKLLSFRFDDGWILRRLNSNFIHVRMRQICPPSVLPMLQHAKGLTTVVVRTQRLVSYRRRSRPSCKSKAPYWLFAQGLQSQVSSKKDLLIASLYWWEAMLWVSHSISGKLISPAIQTAAPGLFLAKLAIKTLHILKIVIGGPVEWS